VLDISIAEVKVSVRNLKMYNLLSADYIPTELIQRGGGNTF
jgi:hypothetical protein